MNTRYLIVSAAVYAIAAFGQASYGQNPLPFYYQFTFSGTSVYTNAAGNLVTKRVTHANWLRDYARANGVRNLKTIALLYHVNGDERGDTIDIVNVTNGVPLYTIFGLYFGESFGRAALVSGDNRQSKEIPYVYSHQLTHSVGLGFLSRQILVDKSGNPTQEKIRATLEYEVLPDPKNLLQVCSGTLVTGKPWAVRGR
jgi:hypothetical protein